MLRFSLLFQVTQVITILSRAMFQVTCIMAIHMTINAIQILANTKGRHFRPNRGDNAVLLGLLTTVVWSAMSLTILMALSGSHGLFWAALALFTLPLAGVVGWQVGQWRHVS